MSSAIFGCGHWRRRDPLDGLTDNMRAALPDALNGLALEDGVYRAPHGAEHAPSTIRALAERGLLALSGGPDGRRRAFRLTRAGREAVAEIHRRAAVRRKLEARA